MTLLSRRIRDAPVNRLASTFQSLPFVGWPCQCLGLQEVALPMSGSAGRGACRSGGLTRLVAGGRVTCHVSYNVGKGPRLHAKHVRAVVDRKHVSLTHGLVLRHRTLRTWEHSTSFLFRNSSCQKGERLDSGCSVIVACWMAKVSFHISRCTLHIRTKLLASLPLN